MRHSTKLHLRPPTTDYTEPVNSSLIYRIVFQFIGKLKATNSRCRKSTPTMRGEISETFFDDV